MLSAIYVEREVRNHPRTQAVLKRYPKVSVIECERYGEIFNRRSQNFRLQKKKPALILARKHEKMVLPAPDAYGLGGDRNYYFSHMLNCVYDCRYCFLQGMYRSANYVLFINYEDFYQDIRQTVSDNPHQTCYFYSGYDCDSLAMEPMTGFVESALPVFKALPQAYLELRTKSTQIRSLLEQQPLPNVVVAFSLSPELVIKNLEHRTPGLDRRLEAIARLGQAGWPIGLRFDPIVYYKNYQENYNQFFEKVFSVVEPDFLHSVSLGAFRLPEVFFNNMVRLYPEEKLFAGPLEKRENMMSYQTELEAELMAFCQQEILRSIPDERFFPCRISTERQDLKQVPVQI